MLTNKPGLIVQSLIIDLYTDFLVQLPQIISLIDYVILFLSRNLEEKKGVLLH